MIDIARGVAIDENELVFQSSRSSGPGGQNVNKVSSRVTVLFDVNSCRSLSSEQKSRILRRLHSRATKDGVIHVSSQVHRSQAANRQAAIERLAELLSGALRRPAPRKPTAVPQRCRIKRLENKARRGRLKKLRSGDDIQD